MTFAIKVKDNRDAENWILNKTLNHLEEVQEIQSFIVNSFWDSSAQFIR